MSEICEIGEQGVLIACFRDKVHAQHGNVYESYNQFVDHLTNS